MDLGPVSRLWGIGKSRQVFKGILTLALPGNRWRLEQVGWNTTQIWFPFGLIFFFRHIHNTSSGRIQKALLIPVHGFILKLLIDKIESFSALRRNIMTRSSKPWIFITYLIYCDLYMRRSRLLSLLLHQFKFTLLLDFFVKKIKKV